MPQRVRQKKKCVATPYGIATQIHWSGRRLAAEVVIHDAGVLNAETLKHGDDGLGHRAGATHVVLDVLRGVVVLEVGGVHDVVDEARRIADASRVGGRVGPVESQVEVEVGILLFEVEEVGEVEDLVEGASAIEIVHLPVRGVERLGHVHNLRTQRGHAGTATDPNHLPLGVEVRMEIAIGAAHQDLVARLEREDV